MVRQKSTAVRISDKCKNNAKIARFCCGSRQAARFKERDKDRHTDGDRDVDTGAETDREGDRETVYNKSRIVQCINKRRLGRLFGSIAISTDVHFLIITLCSQSRAVENSLVFFSTSSFCSFLFSFNVLCRTKVDLIVVVVVVVKGLRKSQQEITIIQKE